METTQPSRYQRYIHWSDTAATITNVVHQSTKQTCKVIQQLKRKIENVFNSDVSVSEGQPKPYFLHLMCGDGSIAKIVKQNFHEIGLNQIRAHGVELRQCYIDAWNEKLAETDRIYKCDLLESGFQLEQFNGGDETNKPISIIWQFGTSYLYVMNDNICGTPAEFADQPRIESAILAIHHQLTSHGVAFLTDLCPGLMGVLMSYFSKRSCPYGTLALIHACEKENVPYSVITFKDITRMPKVTDEIFQALTAENLETYDNCHNEQVKEVRDMLEFISHTPLEEIGMEEYGKLDFPQFTFESFNSTKRRQYLRAYKLLAQYCSHELPIYYQTVVLTSSQASKEFVNHIHDEITNFYDTSGASIDFDQIAEFKSQCVELLERHED